MGHRGTGTAVWSTAARGIMVRGTAVRGTAGLGHSGPTLIQELPIPPPPPPQTEIVLSMKWRTCGAKYLNFSCHGRPMASSQTGDSLTITEADTVVRR